MSILYNPLDDRRRVNRLRELCVLDTEPELVFDTLTCMASEVCAVPIAIISLVDEDRQWFKSHIGLPDIFETARVISFCTHAIEDVGIMEVKDALLDARFADNPLVTGYPHIRFYAGAPLVTLDGSRVGTLCVIDRVPRVLAPEQRSMLRQLAAAVSEALEFREGVIRSVGLADRKSSASSELMLVN